MEGLVDGGEKIFGQVRDKGRDGGEILGDFQRRETAQEVPKQDIVLVRGLALEGN